jgi:gluconate:H+ symporter, GntP family
MSETTPQFGTAKQKVAHGPLIGLVFAAVMVAAAGTVTAVLSGRAEWADFMEYRWPFFNLGISVGVCVLLISIARLHAFLALMLAAAASGFITTVGSLPNEPAMNHWVAAVELTSAGLGILAGKVGLVIALAAVIGACLFESGAADKVVRRFLAVFGEKRAGLALLAATYIVSIPIFFETIFMLLVPLARSLRRSTGKDYIQYLMAICCSGAIMHTLVIPHPGPTALADTLKIQAGLSILVGMTTGLVPLAAGWLSICVMNRLMHVNPFAAGIADQAEEEPAVEPEENLPPFLWSLAPIVLPVLLISLASLTKALGSHCPAILNGLAQFLGNRNVALAIGMVIAAGVLMRHRGLGLAELSRRVGPPLEMAATIILIVCAGGAFGEVLKAAGIDKAIEKVAENHPVNLIVLSYLVAAVLRVAQGSTTAAMIITGSIIQPMMSKGLPYHPIYIFLSTAYGALFASWMNDGGFWVVSKLGRLSEKQTLASWTILTCVISVAGLLMALALSNLLPMAR